MHIVPDANIIIAEGYGSSRRFRQLLSLLETLQYNLYVPKLVIEEVVAKFERDFDEDIEEIKRRVKDLSLRLDKELSSHIDELDRAHEISSSRQRLEARFGASNCTILDYPVISHEELVRRATTRTKPFDNEGSGYRDALIWETVLNLATEVDSEVVFISNDNDFSNRKHELHIELKNQLVDRGLTEDKVILLRSLSTFITDLQSRLPQEVSSQ